MTDRQNQKNDDTPDARIDFRCRREEKSIIEEAAAVEGQSLTDFARQTLVSVARETLWKHKATRLTEQDHERFMELIESEDPPASYLVQAAERYRSVRMWQKNASE